MAKTQPSMLKRMKPVWKPEPIEAPTYYANLAELRMGPLDFRLRLGQLIDVNKDQSSVLVKTLATVYLSPEHAKDLANLLLRNVQRFEQQFGPIPQVEAAADGEDD